MLHLVFSWWNLLVERPLLILLTLFSQHFGLGGGILLLTLLVRLVLWPFNYISFKYSQQMMALQDEIAKLKKKHKNDSAAFQKAQAELMRDKGVVPAAGCLPGVVQFILLIALYRVLLNQVTAGGYDLNFWWLNLAKPDPYYILPVLAGLFQVGGSLFFQPPTKNEQVKTQQQMMAIMSLVTVFIASKFASGIVLFWVVSSFISLLQQFIIRRQLWKKN